MSVITYFLEIIFQGHKLKGYACRKHNNTTHNFFVDGFKLYINSRNIAKKQLDLVTVFPEDAGIRFEYDKCVYK